MFPFNLIRKKYNELRNEITVERSPTEKKFNAVCSVAGGLFLCFWGGLILVLIGPYLIAIPIMRGTELLYVVATFVVCGIIFLTGAVLILQSKTPPLMKRCFYGMLSLPTALFGLWMGWGMIQQFGFVQIILAFPAALIVLAIHWARLAFRRTIIRDSIANHRANPSSVGSLNTEHFPPNTKS